MVSVRCRKRQRLLRAAVPVLERAVGRTHSALAVASLAALLDELGRSAAA
jgi:hypothetical protein